MNNYKLIVLLNISHAEILAARESAPSLVVLLAPRRKRKNPNRSLLTRIPPARKKGNPPGTLVDQLHH